MPRQRRVRLRDLVANANAKVNQAGGAINNLNELIDLVDIFVDELMDGVTFTIVRKGEGSLMDFLNGKIDELPIGIKLLVDEEPVT
jgi:hypothetical protein